MFDLEHVKSFFQHLLLPVLSTARCNALDADISEDEIAWAIKSLKLSKAPGPDGFLGHYSKKFATLLTPHLAAYFNLLKQDSQPSSESLKAHITKISKTSHEATDPQTFRPISLLNMDLKILEKVLSTRVNKYLQTLIHRDHVGFVQGK